MMEYLNSGIVTIIAACCLFAAIKALIDWLKTRAEGERKHLTFLFSLLFIVNLAVLWFLSR